MKRAIVACCAACLGAYAVLAASPEVESAIKAFKAVAADPAKLSAFCTMTRTLDGHRRQDDEDVADAKVAELIKQLGPEFEAAWKTDGRPSRRRPRTARRSTPPSTKLVGKCPKQ